MGERKRERERNVGDKELRSEKLQVYAIVDYRKATSRMHGGGKTDRENGVKRVGETKHLFD